MNYYAYDIATPRKPSKQSKLDFSASRTSELQFGVKLRRVAQFIEDAIKHGYDGTLNSVYQIEAMMQQYSALLGPWASAVLQHMHKEVDARDKTQWAKAANVMGVELRREIEYAPTGVAMRRLLDEQVHLIRSIPLDAARRVHDMTVEQLSSGGRAEHLVEEIMRQGDVSRSKATLIARTETARTASVLTEVRAVHLGSPGYVWETAKDGTVRASHKRLQGTVQNWNSPPLSDPPNYHSHPGQIWRCRCWARPIFPSL